MSQQQEDFDIILPDGRKTADLKVIDLKKELEKMGQRRSGTKSELLTRLNDIIKGGASYSPNIAENSKENPKEENVILRTSHIEEKKIPRKSKCKVDLDDSDDMKFEGGEINQSMDTLDIGAPVDDSLNPIEETLNPIDDAAQEDQIQISLSKDEEADMNIGDSRVVVMPNKDEDDNNNDNKDVIVENECEEVLNIEEIEAQLEEEEEIYEGGDNIIVTVVNDNKTEEEEKVDETEEGEVVTLPITARLGKRKVVEGGGEEGEMDDDEEDNDGVDKGERKMKSKKKKKGGLKETKGAGHIVEEPVRVEEPHKSKQIISDILRVDNLVRPFTMTQLQDVLSIKGRVIDLWINKIKSVAYVKYEDESAAIKARENLDGCRWPSINPKLLVADFSTFREMEWMKEKGDSGLLPPATHNLKHTSDNNNNNNSNIEPIVWNNNKEEKERRRRPHGDDNIEENKMRRRSRSIEKKRRHHHHHRDGSPTKANDTIQPPPVAAAKLLEDLFRKTVAQPAIYWLPKEKIQQQTEPVSKIGDRKSAQRLLN